MAAKTHSWLLAAVCVVGAALRLWGLHAASFGADEIAILRAAETRFGMPSGAPLVDAPTLRAWWVPGAAAARLTAWGYGEALHRLPSAVLGSLAIPLVALAATRLFGGLAGLLAATMIALAPAAVHDSVTLGGGAWATLLVAACVYCLLRARPLAEQRLWTAALLALLGLATLSVGAVALWLAICLWLWSDGARVGRPLRLLLALAAAGLLAILTLMPPVVVPELVRQPLAWTTLLSLGGTHRLGSGVLLLALSALGVVVAWTRVGRVARLPIWWLAAALLTLGWSWWQGGRPIAADRALLEVPIAMLAGAALAWLIESFAPRLGHAAGAALGLVICGAILVPTLVRQAGETPLPWPQVAALVRANLGADERIVVMLERDRFVFYAPDLEPRVEVPLPPGRALAFFADLQRGWLIAPRSVRFYGAWPRIAAWVEQFRVVDLSPDPRLYVYYFDSSGRANAMRRVATFDLPPASLARDNLLYELLREHGPLQTVLWKVDQLALAPTPGWGRNPSLLAAVHLLIERGHPDRAAALAYRLAGAAPDWPEAQQLLAAFQPDDG